MMKRELLDASFVRREMAWWNVPGVQIGVVRADSNGNPETLYSSGFGFRDVEHNLPMTPASLGGIASCSKAFTAAIVASLVEEGKLDWDRPIREYLPFFALKDPLPLRNVPFGICFITVPVSRVMTLCGPTPIGPAAIILNTPRI